MIFLVSRGFSIATLVILALTVAMIVQRVRLRLKGNWPLVYYAAALAYAFAFPYSISPYVLLAGAVCAVLLRFKAYRPEIRMAEVLVLLYVTWRSIALLMGW